MPTSGTTRTVTLRLPLELYQQTVEIAHRQNKSLNALLQEGAQWLIQEEETRTLGEGFELLAEHPEECDAEYALYAQAEVALNDDL